MKLSKEDLVLYSLHLLRDGRNVDLGYTKEQLADVIGISSSTLDLYLTKLKTDGLINRIKKRYIHDLNRTTEITDSGLVEIKRISSTVNCMLLTEQRHNLPKCIELTKVMDKLPDPLEKAFFLSLYNQSKYMDIPMLLSSLKLSKDETNFLLIFNDQQSNPCGIINESFVELFFSASPYGVVDWKKFNATEWPKEDLNAMLCMAQAKVRMGQFEDSAMILDYILSRSDLTSNQWFLAKMSYVRLEYRKGELESALRMIDDILVVVDDRLKIAYAKMVKADILFYYGQVEEGMNIYKSTLSSFRTFGLPLFLSLTYNNRGVCHYVSGKLIDAEQDWIKARRYAKEARSVFEEALVLPNLASIAMKAGKYELSNSYLERAYRIFKEKGDLEGITVVEHNRALLALEKGDLEGIKEHCLACFQEGFPFPTKYMQNLYKKDLMDRAREKGIEGVEAILALY